MVVMGWSGEGESHFWCSARHPRDLREASADLVEMPCVFHSAVCIWDSILSYSIEVCNMVLKVYSSPHFFNRLATQVFREGVRGVRAGCARKSPRMFRGP